MKYRVPSSVFRIALAHLLILIICIETAPARAHTEGALQLTSAPAGPYMVSAWTSPDPAETGKMHVALAVALAEDASPVLDAEVLVTLEHVENNEKISAPATTDDSENKFLYEAIVDVEKNGIYEVTILISGSDGTSGETSFELEVHSNSNTRLFIFLGGAVVFLALLLLGLFRRRPSKQSPVDSNAP